MDILTALAMAASAIPLDPLGDIQAFANNLAAEIQALLLIVENAIETIAKISAIGLVMVGALLYFSHVSRWLGRSLLVGGVILAILAVWVFPWMMTIQL